MKYILIILCVIFCSCEDYNQYKNGVDTSAKAWENKKPEFLEGLYETNRIDSEPGYIIFTTEKVIISTKNHHHEFKYSEYMNAIGTYDNGKDCNWSIHVNDIQYRFTTSSGGKHTLFMFKRKSETKFNRVGVYSKDLNNVEPVTEPQEPIYN